MRAFKFGQHANSNFCVCDGEQFPEIDTIVAFGRRRSCRRHSLDGRARSWRYEGVVAEFSRPVRVSQRLIELPQCPVGQVQSATATNGVLHILQAVGESACQLSRVEAEDMPAALLQKVVAPVVLPCPFGIAVPHIAIALDVNVALRTEKGEVQAVHRLAGSLIPLPLRLDAFLLEGSPEAILQRTSVVQIIDLQGLYKLLPHRPDENDASSPSAENWLMALPELSQPQSIVRLVRTWVIGFIGKEFDAPNFAN